MARRREAAKRKVVPDPIYHDELVGQITSKIMRVGKKIKAQSIIYGALDILKTKVKDRAPLDVFKQALANVAPVLEVKSRRVGGATYQVPVEVRKERGINLAMKWILEFARARKGMPMKEKLAAEILDAYNKQGAAMKRREDTHKMAEANKAFAHFKW